MPRKQRDIDEPEFIVASVDVKPPDSRAAQFDKLEIRRRVPASVVALLQVELLA